MNLPMQNQTSWCTLTILGWFVVFFGTPAFGDDF